MTSTAHSLVTVTPTEAEVSYEVPWHDAMQASTSSLQRHKSRLSVHVFDKVAPTTGGKQHARRALTVASPLAGHAKVASVMTNPSSPVKPGQSMRPISVEQKRLHAVAEAIAIITLGTHADRTAEQLKSELKPADISAARLAAISSQACATAISLPTDAQSRINTQDMAQLVGPQDAARLVASVMSSSPGSDGSPVAAEQALALACTLQAIDKGATAAASFEDNLLSFLLTCRASTQRRDTRPVLRQLESAVLTAKPKIAASAAHASDNDSVNFSSPLFRARLTPAKAELSSFVVETLSRQAESQRHITATGAHAATPLQDIKVLRTKRAFNGVPIVTAMRPTSRLQSADADRAAVGGKKMDENLRRASISRDALLREARGDRMLSKKAGPTLASRRRL